MYLNRSFFKMGSWWRSEEMTYVSLIISEEAAAGCVREFGILKCLQFSDLNPELTPFQRRYVAYIKRCDEIERKIRYIHTEVKKMGIPVSPAGVVEDFVQNDFKNEDKTGAYLLEQLEAELEQKSKNLEDLVKFSERLTEEYTCKVCTR